jgi:hypothetical protein
MGPSLPPGPRVARTLTRERALLATLATSLWFASGCGPGAATPMPEPPPLSPTLPVDITLVGPPHAVIVPTTEGTAQELDGAPGAAPSNAVVRVTNLDGADPAYATTASADGHFAITLPVKFGDELRFEWLLGTDRSVPVDALYLADTSGSFQLQPSPRFDCVTLSPGFVLDFGAAQHDMLSLQVQNNCSTELSIDSHSLRRNLPDFSCSTATPLTFAAGTSATLDVNLARTGNAVVEDTLFFNLTQSGTTIRYPVTLSTDP